MSLTILHHDQLAAVCGGYNLKHALDAGNSMGLSAATSGGFVGTALGIVAGGISHYRGKRLFGLTTRMPAPAEGGGAGLVGGGGVVGGLGWGWGFIADSAGQLTGRITVPPGGSSDDGG